MAAKKRKKRRKSSASPLDLIRDRLDWVTAGRLARAGVWVLVVAAFVVGWALGVPALERRAAAIEVPAEPPVEVEVRFLDAPAWMNGDLEAQLVLTARDRLGTDALRRDDLVAARDALRQTGWFTEVRQVRRLSVRRVVIDAEFVQPYAVIRDGAGDHLVDPHGRLLPRSVPVGGAPRFTAIIGVAASRPAQPGGAWTGDDITAALRLKRLIDTRPWKTQVRGIDVTGFAREQSLSLITDRGHRIIWGRPPGDENAGEVGVDRKLYYLDYPFQQFGRIDGGYEGELDITDPRGVFGR